MARMVTITVNGKKEALDGPMSLLDLLREHDLEHRRVAIGYNGDVVHRNHWNDITLGEGDVVDIVQMVGGG